MMTTRSKYRGHDIVYKNSRWFYADNNEPTINNERPCGHCLKDNTKEGHDYCLNTLPNVMNACCGHGIIDEAYIQFQNRDIIRGEKTIKWIKLLKGTKHYV